MAATIGPARVRVPARARAGEVIEIRTPVSHPMENGQRRDAEGAVVPRYIIRRFEARFEGELVFATDLHTGVAANPYIAFPFRVERAERFEFVWIDDAGEEARARAELRVG